MIEKQKINRRVPRVFLACVISLGMLIASVSAYSDTYNFYFTKPKKKGGAVDNAPAADSDEQEESDTPAAPKEESEAPAAQSGQVSVTPNGQQPIIINNNNNIHMPSGPAAPAVSEPEPAPAPSAAATVTTAVLHDDHVSRWHFGLSAAMYTGKRDSYWDYHYDYDGSYSSGYEYSSLGTQWAGLINVGVDFTRVFGLNLYASQVVSSNRTAGFDTGGDFEFSPFRIGGLKYDYFKLGILAGTGVAYLTDTSFPFDLGARATINLDEQFGVTGAFRTNFKVAMAEVGIVTHF